MLRSALALILAGTVSAAEPVSFRNDVSAVLSRAGCNAGACHGNLNGKGGLRLSLRGEDPDFDLAALTRGMHARRVDPQSPVSSLLLLKATGAVPHDGGARFGLSSPEYAILKAWIASGANPDPKDTPRLKALTLNATRHIAVEPQDRVSIRATAEFGDGSRRDVTGLACFDASNIGVVKVLPNGDVQREQPGESVVTVRYLDRQVPVRIAFLPNRSVPDMTSLAGDHPIDVAVRNDLAEMRIPPAPLADDSTFLRRIFLDTLGVLPTVSEAKAFLADVDSNKRTKLIDKLLERPEFATYWSQKWSDVLRNEEKSLDPKGVQVYSRWIRQWIAEDRPLNEFASEIVRGRGSPYDNPAASFYRAVREPYQRAESVAQVFLGLRIGCAKCHNHPFDRWTQDDYHRFAAFFNRVQYRIADPDRQDKFDKHLTAGEVFVVAGGEPEFPHPRGGTAAPKFLGAATPDLTGRKDRLGALADWLADPANPFFAPAQANRIWSHFLGRGIVEPIDDFKAANPASNPALLQHLAAEFRSGGFRLKPMVKHSLTSRTYQLASRTTTDDETHFAHSLAQPLEAEQLLDAIGAAAGSRGAVRFPGYPAGTRAGEMPASPTAVKKNGDAPAMRFLKVFGKPDRQLTCECERSDDPGILQAFQMVTGDTVQKAIRDPKNRVAKLIEAEKIDAEILGELYLAAFSRNPKPVEMERLLAVVSQSADRRGAWEDVLWGLLNSKEFLLRK